MKSKIVPSNIRQQFCVVGWVDRWSGCGVDAVALSSCV